MEEFEIKNLLSVSGMPGVYRFRGFLKNGNLVVERLTTGDRTNINPKKSQITKFGNVYIETNDGNIGLEQVIEKLYETENIPDFVVITPDEQRDFMQRVVPGYDKQKFKPYHMTKILGWFKDINIAVEILTNGYVDPYEEETKEEQ